MNNEVMNVENVEPQKPMTVAKEDFVNNLTDIINNSGLPAFVIEPVMKDMYFEVRDVAQKQYKQDNQQYQSALASFANTVDGKHKKQSEEKQKQ